MPRFGLTMHEGTIQRFFKAEGERVTAGEPLYEVETEKVLYQVEAPASGTLAIALFDEGATVECGVAIAVIAETGEDVATVATHYGYSKSASQPAHDSPVTSPPAINQTAAPNPSRRDRHTASPVARKLASELGVDLDKIEGTGPGGRVTREDVERGAKSAATLQPAISRARPPTGSGSAPSADRVAFRGVRKVIAERMLQSLHSSAQITITAEADVTPATEFRARLSREFDFSYTDMMIHSVARALMRHPRMNARLEGAEIVCCASANIGVAVALEEGLIVPVVQRAESKSLREIAVESRALSEKARAGHLKLEDVTGGTFTITNLGMFGVDAFTPI